MSTPDSRVKNIVKLFASCGYRHDRHAVFTDCMTAIACAISNAVDLRHREAREADYMRIVARYGADDMRTFTKVLAEITLALEEQPGDVFGSVFGAMELGNKHAGQFFTPYEVCRLMAAMTVGDGADMRSLIERHGFVTAQEPAVGAGAMVIALAQEMRCAGINYQQHLHVTAIDVDRRAALMAYVQFSLLHIPATVLVGNTISLEIRETWHTPAHILGGWGFRLGRRWQEDSSAQDERENDAAAPVTPSTRLEQPTGMTVSAPTGQLVLF